MFLKQTAKKKRGNLYSKTILFNNIKLKGHQSIIKYGLYFDPDSNKQVVKKEKELNVCVYILYIYDNQRNFNTNLILNDIRELLFIVLGRIIVLGLLFFF